MRVKCQADSLSLADRQALGLPANAGYPVSVGSEYLVYGIRYLAGRTWISLAAPDEYLFGAPLSLFTITDPRVARSWRVTMLSEDGVAIEPELLGQAGFFERLSEADPEARRSFDRLKQALEADDGYG